MKRFVACLVVIVLGAGVVLTSTSPTSAATIADMVTQVDATQYEAYQLAVESMGLGLYNPSYDQGYRDRDGWQGDGSLGNQEARLYLTNQFSSFGLNVAVQGGYRNVVGELPGTTSPDNVVIVCGHYDHVGGSVGDERPGGDDNASGTAGVLEAARVLSQYQFESTVRFIGFNAEEDGLLGSKDYVNNVIVPGGENVLGVINLDMILRPGWDNNASEASDLDVITKNVSVCTDWADTFITAAESYVSTLNIEATTPYTGSSWGASDHGPFANAGYPALLAIEGTPGEIWGGSNEYYHGPEDASDRLANDPESPSGVTYDYDFATGIVAATVATVAQTAVLVPSGFDPADFDRNGNVDIVDVNFLTAEANLPVGLSAPPADAKFDLNGDGTVDTADLDRWLTDAATINNLASPYLRGDANLDGDVDVWESDGTGDAQVLSENLGTMTGMVWGDGDFNGDGDVDVWALDGSGDAQVLSANLGSSSSDFAPEAGTGTAEAIYNAATGELSFDVGDGVGVVGIGSAVLYPDAVNENSILGSPDQRNTGSVAFFAADNLPTGEASLGFLLPAGLAQDDMLFSYTPIGGKTMSVPVTMIVPEPNMIAMLLVVGSAGIFWRRRHLLEATRK